MPEPTVPKKRRPTRRTRERWAGIAEDVKGMAGREERIVTDRPEGGNRDYGIDPRPRNVRIHLGKRWAQIMREIKNGDYTWKQFAESLSAEELARGQLKDRDGGFKGRPPQIVPREFHLACFRELKRRFDEEFQSGVLAIAKEYVTLAQDKSLPVKDRARMMQYAMERVFGSIPKEVLVKQEAPWEAVFTTIVNEADDEAPDWRKNRYAEFDEDAEAYDDEEEADG